MPGRDLSPLDAARQRLAQKHLGAAIARGAAWARLGGPEPDDVIAASQLGLVLAAATFRHRSAPWKVWARVCIDGACRREIRDWTRYHRRRGDDEVLSTMAAPEPPESCPELAEAWRQLPDRERQVLMMRYGLGWTYSQIGESIGLTGSGTCQIERRALGRLREALDGPASAA